MLSAAEGRKQRAQLDRERAKAIREAERKRVADLKAASRRARAEAPAGRVEAKASCKAERALAGLECVEVRTATKQIAKTACGNAREQARASCAAAKAAPSARVKAARAALRDELAHLRALRRIERDNRRAKASSPRASRREQRSESDGEVRGNIPAELVPFWERVKRGLKGNARRTRTEAFLQYAEEHPAESIVALEESSDAKLEAMIAERVRNPWRASMRKANPCSCSPRAKNPDVVSFEEFHGGRGRTRDIVAEWKSPRGPFMLLGELVGIAYKTDKGAGNVEYEHDFSRPRAYLVRDGRGDLQIIRGPSRYTVEDRGIVG